jgi:hypothetical protein
VALAPQIAKSLTRSSSTVPDAHQEGQNFVHATRRYFSSGDNSKFSHLVLPARRTIVPVHVSRNSSRAGKSRHVSNPRFFSLNLAVRILTSGNVWKGPFRLSCLLAGGKPSAGWREAKCRIQTRVFLQQRRLFPAMIEPSRSQTMSPKRPTHVLIDQVRVTREGSDAIIGHADAIIDHADTNVSGARIVVGPASRR